MMRRLLRDTLLYASVAGLMLAPLVLAQGSGEDVEKFKVKLLGVETFYGQEKWKTSPLFAGSSREAVDGAVRTDAGRYDGALGYRVALRIQLTDEAGNNVPADPIENRNVNVSAQLQTPRGSIPAYVQRMPGTIPGQSDSLVFKLFFDVDGTTAMGAARAAIEGLPSGPTMVRVNVFKQGLTDRVDAGHDDLAFYYTRPSSTITIDGFGERDYLAEVPDNTFRLLNDIGHGDTVPFVTDQVADTRTLRASYAFGVAGKTVRWMALTATPCSTPNCAPTNGAAAVEVFSREIATNVTDATGNVSFSIPVRDLLSYPGRTAPFSAALVVVAASLVPEATLPPDLGTQYAKGSYDITTGADEFVIPVSNRVSRVIGYAIDTRLAENLSRPSQNPAAQQAAKANVLQVSIYDDAGQPCANCGDAVAIVPDGRFGVLGNGTIHSMPDPNFATKYREASIPVAGMHDKKVSWYRILALLYGSSGNGERDVFQGMTYADRGFTIETSSMPTRITDQATYHFNITSRSTNYDLRAREPQFEMKVIYRVTTENGMVRNQTVTIPEGGVSSQQIKISSSRVGTLGITYEATSGDTLVGPVQDSATFHDRPPKKRLADRIPGFEVVLLGVALLGAVVLARRREAF